MGKTVLWTNVERGSNQSGWSCRSSANCSDPLQVSDFQYNSIHTHTLTGTSECSRSLWEATRAQYCELWNVNGILEFLYSPSSCKQCIYSTLVSLAFLQYCFSAAWRAIIHNSWHSKLVVNRLFLWTSYKSWEMGDLSGLVNGRLIPKSSPVTLVVQMR